VSPADERLQAQARQWPHDGRRLPLATTRRERRTAVEFFGDLSDAGDTLSPNVLHDCAKVVRVLLRLFCSIYVRVFNGLQGHFSGPNHSMRERS
jgi:hypothetical protein